MLRSRFFFWGGGSDTVSFDREVSRFQWNLRNPFFVKRWLGIRWFMQHNSKFYRMAFCHTKWPIMLGLILIGRQVIGGIKKRAWECSLFVQWNILGYSCLKFPLKDLVLDARFRGTNRLQWRMRHFSLGQHCPIPPPLHIAEPQN